MVQSFIQAPPHLRDPALGDCSRIANTRQAHLTYGCLHQKTTSETRSLSTAKTGSHFRQKTEVFFTCSLPCCKQIRSKYTLRQQEVLGDSAGVDFWDYLDAADSSASNSAPLWKESTSATAAR